MDRFERRTFIEPVNTMVLPGIDVEEDIARINDGHGVSIGHNRWQIDGRIYADKGNGAAFPVSGVGVISPSRLELIALQMLIRSGGDLEDLYRRTHQHPDFDDTIRTSAAGLFAIWSEARRKRI